MKKRIGFMVLLIAVAAGMAFAQNSGGYNGRPIPFQIYKDGGFATPYYRDIVYHPENRMNPDQITITSVTQTLVGVNVTYDCNDIKQDVLFRFRASFNDGSPDKTWEDVEKLRGWRSGSTWRFTVLNCYRIKQLDITWRPN